jgi:hypothetical protein
MDEEFTDMTADDRLAWVFHSRKGCGALRSRLRINRAALRLARGDKRDRR